MKNDIDFCLFSMTLKNLSFIDESKLKRFPVTQSMIQWDLVSSCPAKIFLPSLSRKEAKAKLAQRGNITEFSTPEKTKRDIFPKEILYE